MRLSQSREVCCEPYVRPKSARRGAGLRLAGEYVDVEPRRAGCHERISVRICRIHRFDGLRMNCKSENKRLWPNGNVHGTLYGPDDVANPHRVLGPPRAQMVPILVWILGIPEGTGRRALKVHVQRICSSVCKLPCNF